MSLQNSRQISDVKVMLLKGVDGDNIQDIEKTGQEGLTDIYTITLTNGSKTTFRVTNGNSVVSITKTSTSGLIDTYTITYSDGTKSTFTVTNGTNGSNANLADVAPSLVAQKDYEVNEHIIYDEVYYIVTQPIAEGDDIIIGTNVEQRKVGDEISFIANIRVDNSIFYLPRTGVSVADRVLNVNMFN